MSAPLAYQSLFQTINYAFPTNSLTTATRIPPAFVGRCFARDYFPALYRTLLAARTRLTPEKRELPIRKWLVTSAFVAGIAVIVDLIALVNTFLSGEITTLYFENAHGASSPAACSVILFMICDTGTREPKAKCLRGSPRLPYWLRCRRFTIMGSPSAAREQRFDDKEFPLSRPFSGRL